MIIRDSMNDREDYIEELEAEVERLREALGKIHRLTSGRNDSVYLIARAALEDEDE